MVGRTLSHYRILDEISRGGMGVVYRALDVNLDREVALKVLPEDLVHEAQRRERLVQEARAASALEHPNVAVIHEVGEADGVTFIAMELIRGEKLSEILARGPLGQARTFSLATEMAEGLSRAHEKGIIHRDLKPANIMVTGDGHAKIIDFGLAKLVVAAEPDAATVSIDGPRTDAGMVLGTASYMSPEQARGERVDHRTDIFALGVTLYEMLTGRRAFQGRSAIDTMQAVLTQPVPPLPGGSTATAEGTAALQRIITKCTEKEPDDRYQGMKDLIVDLRAARRRLESSSSAPAVTSAGGAVPAAGRTGGATLIAAVLVLLAAAAAAVAWWTNRPAATVAPSGKPALAVLYFENNTGDPSLDWMRTGLADMIVTDLSQSTHIEVVGTDRIVQILQEIKREDDRSISSSVVQEVAARAGADNVLIGSYVKAGGTIRISARLQDARTGRIVSAERVEGQGESGLFTLVDELTRRFRARMSELAGGGPGPLLARPGEAAEQGLDRGVNEITTSSIEAYRYYADGIHFHERGQTAQAVPLLEKAVQIDPGFAMAYAKLAVLTHNLGLQNQRDEYAKRALTLTDRLTSRERHYIEGFYYGLRADTRARSIEVYTRGLALHPEHQASRHNLGLHLLALERFTEAIEQYEELVRRGTSNPTSHENLADALVSTGNISRARQVADDFVRRYPDNAGGRRMLGMVLIAEGRLDEARAALEKSQALNPLDYVAKIGARNAAHLQGRLGDVEAAVEEFGRSSSAFERMLSLVGAQSLAALRGQGERMVELSERAAALPGLGPQQRAAAMNRSARTLIRVGRFEAALSRAEAARREAQGQDAEFENLQLLAQAQAAAGRNADAEATLAQLEARARALAPVRELRRVHWARGSIALRRGDAATAAAELARAAAMLPVHGPPLGPPSSHADLWFDAAQALISAKRDGDAAQLLERLQSGHERVFALDAYVRGLYLLAQIEERRGNAARARELYAAFVDRWGGGDLQRDWVQDAKSRLARAQ